MDQIDRILAAAPFHLGAEARDWVRTTLAAMDRAAKVRQLFVHICFGTGPEVAERTAALAPAGITKFFGPDAAAELDTLDALRGAAVIPYLVSADLEGSRMSPPFGTEVPNPLALAAVDDVEASSTIARIMATEARAAGINWSFTPVIDINALFRSPIVATRGLGSDPDRIRRHALAHIAGLQANGVAATVKHWPGEGHDDRDQRRGQRQRRHRQHRDWCERGPRRVDGQLDRRQWRLGNDRLRRHRFRSHAARQRQLPTR